MAGYEGKTVRLRPRCPLCSGEMVEGFLFGEQGAGHGMVDWAEGVPEWSGFGNLRLGRRQRYSVRTYRCSQCGYLAAFAHDPLT
jgi:hypothetical protein